jgi:hypothetical protein
MRRAIARSGPATTTILFLGLFLGACGGCGGDRGGEGNGGNEVPDTIAPALDRVAPNRGLIDGGTEVRLEGRGFFETVSESRAVATELTAVWFGDAEVFEVEVISNTVIRVVTPPGIPGPVDVRLENPNGETVCAGCFTYEAEEVIEPPPVVEVRIDRVAPARGPSEGGTRVRIEGRGFVEGFAILGDQVRDQTAILFGGNTAIDFDVIDDRVIDVVTPPGSIGDRNVVVQNPNGEAVCAGCFHYYVPVRATAVVPDASPVEGGVAVTLTGAGLIEGTVVIVGGRSAVSPVRVDDETFTFITPPSAAAGAVDVTVLNANGRDTLRRRLTYYQDPHLTSVEPPVGTHAGGTTVRLKGEGLLGATQVTFGGVPATDLRTAGPDLLVTSPSGSAGSVVDVEVIHPRGDTRLSGAFAYVDPAVRDVSLLSITPAYGPVAGGQTVTLAGTGLDHPDPQVRFGAVDADPATIVVVDAHRLTVTVPAAAGPGAVDVQVRNDRGGSLLADGYAYEVPIVLSSIDPASGPAAGGTAVTLSGSGFDAEVEVRIGALFASDVTVVDAETITATAPPGSAGPADVVVRRGSGEARRQAVLAGGFTYVEPLVLAQVDPPRGSQAGGTYVLLSGSGFTDETTVRFGAEAAAVLDRWGHNLMAVRSPAGTIGLVDVAVSADGESDVLVGAFQYYDPTNIRGGASGGPMAGTLNVTTLDAYTRAPLAETHVMLGDDPETDFQGETDRRGQITFSDPSLVKALNVTASRRGYQAVTVVRLDARDLTVYMAPNEGEPSDMPPPAPPAFINPTPGSGRVCGFKLPPNITLGENQREEARVWTSVPLVTWLPPFRGLANPQRITQDCGTFGMASRPGNVAVYAKYGIVTTDTDPISGQLVESFEPLLMGITRGIEVPRIEPPVCTPNRACPAGFVCWGEENLDPENPNAFAWCLCNSDAACGEGRICNAAGGCQAPVSADVVLNMHMDLDVPVTLVNPPRPPNGAQAIHATYSYLELGSEGVAFMGEEVNFTDTFTFERHPRLPGDGFVFLNMATSNGGYPLSLYYRRQIGDLASGVDIGPMQPMTRLANPAGGVLSGNRIQWVYEGEPIPDVVNILIEEPGLVPIPVWSIIVPGSETSVTVPPQVMEILRDYPLLNLTTITALSPRFEYDYFSYRQLNLSAWNSFTLAGEYFSVP